MCHELTKWIDEVEAKNKKLKLDKIELFKYNIDLDTKIENFENKQTSVNYENCPIYTEELFSFNERTKTLEK